MTDDRPGKADALLREYKAGRIDANAYVAAGGDPDEVRSHAEEMGRVAAARKAEADRKGGRIAIGCLLIPVVLIGGCWAVTSLGGSSKAATPEAERYGVTSVCEKAVRQQLKDPDSAKFDWSGVAPTSSTSSVFHYEGSGVVRATNSFGGTAVHQFSCIGTYTVSTSLAEATATLKG